jgi:transcriptional regulator with XRE-family HTH domain
MDSVALGAFLRHRRGALQPEDVGMPRGLSRRTDGLRREEVAALVGMSPDYFARLERGAGPQPSVQMVAALARGLRLSVSERDHLFALAGHAVPGSHIGRGAHVGPALMRILDRLPDTPAQVMGGLGETLVQTPLAAALLGDQTGYVGRDRSVVHRWFTDPGSRSIYLAEDHDIHGRVFTAQLRQAVARRGPDSDAAELARHLGAVSPEFAGVWAAQEVGVRHDAPKRFVHPEVGRLDLDCQTLLDPDTDHALLVFTATPGTPSYDALTLLAVLGRTTLEDAT